MIYEMTDAEFRKVAALRFACAYLGFDEYPLTPAQLEKQRLACVRLGIAAADELIRQLKETEEADDATRS